MAAPRRAGRFRLATLAALLATSAHAAAPAKDTAEPVGPLTETLVSDVPLLRMGPAAPVVPFAGATSDDLASAIGIGPEVSAMPTTYRYASVAFVLSRDRDANADALAETMALDGADASAFLLALSNASIAAEEELALRAPDLTMLAAAPVPGMRPVPAEDGRAPVIVAQAATPETVVAKEAVTVTEPTPALFGNVERDPTSPIEQASGATPAVEAGVGGVSPLAFVPSPVMRPEFEALVNAPSSAISVSPLERAGLADPVVSETTATPAFPRFVRPGDLKASAAAEADAAVEMAAYPALGSLQPLSSLDVRLPKGTPKARHTRQICGLIEREANRVGMHPPFFARLINKESRFDPGAVSPVGAQGVAQFMPYTARERGLRDPFEPVEAIPASADYLADLRAMLGNWGLAAAGYNAGPGRVIDFFEGRNLPYETRDYVLSITGMPADHFKTPGAKVENKPLDSKLSFLDACMKLPTMRFKRPKVSGSPVEVAWQPWGVQLSASFVRSSAVASFDRQVKRYGKVLKGKRPLVIRERVRGLSRQKFAARVGAPNRAAAEKLCGQLRSAGGRCMVIKNKK